ncbi:hypothetical protein [uncultured Hymenobacter sp.]|uniref:hypothetical protein n=1 Tax=uncultured Hymenobacter sp. TaxID=170016 RepID=UPI0035CC8DB2
MENQLTTSLPPKSTQLSCWLTAAQQLKDTLTILGMNIWLVFGVLFGVAIPGLLLYFLRWRLVRGTSNPHRALLLWSFSFVHEFFCVLLFQSAEMKAELHEAAGLLSVGYLVGMGVSLIALAEAVHSGHKVESAARL